MHAYIKMQLSSQQDGNLKIYVHTYSIPIRPTPTLLDMSYTITSTIQYCRRERKIKIKKRNCITYIHTYRIHIYGYLNKETIKTGRKLQDETREEERLWVGGRDKGKEIEGEENA